MAAMALQKVLAQVTPKPEETMQVQQAEKEILDLCNAAGGHGSLKRMGAFALGVQEPNAELDLVFVLSEASSAQASQLLEKLQETWPKASMISPQGSFLTAPGLCGLRVAGRDVKLFLAKEDRLPKAGSSLEPSVAALYSAEVSAQILASVPSHDVFRDLLKLVKFWAKRRGLYGKLFGFLEGTTWAVCCARVCQLHPKAVPDLFQFFFKFLCRFDWSTPISLDGRTDGAAAALVLLPGNRYGTLPRHCDVSESVMRVFQRELCRAEQKRIPEVWAEHEFFSRHRQYIRFDFMASSDEILEKWWAWGQQQLPELLQIFESQLDSKVLLRPWPSALPFQDDTWNFAKAALIGLHIQRSEQKSTLDLREIMVKFLEKISEWPQADAFRNHFELMIRAVSAEEIKSWLPSVGGLHVVKEIQSEVTGPAAGTVHGYAAMAATA